MIYRSARIFFCVLVRRRSSPEAHLFAAFSVGIEYMAMCMARADGHKVLLIDTPHEAPHGRILEQARPVGRPRARSSNARRNYTVCHEHERVK